MKIVGGSVCQRRGDRMCKGPAWCCAQAWWDEKEASGLGTVCNSNRG